MAEFTLRHLVIDASRFRHTRLNRTSLVGVTRLVTGAGGYDAFPCVANGEDAVPEGRLRMKAATCSVQRKTHVQTLNTYRRCLWWAPTRLKAI